MAHGCDEGRGEHGNGRGGEVSEQRRLPLAGIRILDLARLGPGPHSSQILADFGADIIWVDPPPKGGNELTMPRVIRRNMRSMILNLKSDGGREVLRKLVQSVDVVTTRLATTMPLSSSTSSMGRLVWAPPLGHHAGQAISRISSSSPPARSNGGAFVVTTCCVRTSVPVEASICTACCEGVQRRADTLSSSKPSWNSCTLGVEPGSGEAACAPPAPPQPASARRVKRAPEARSPAGTRTPSTRPHVTIRFPGSGDPASPALRDSVEVRPA